MAEFQNFLQSLCLTRDKTAELKKGDLFQTSAHIGQALSEFP